MRRRRVLVLNHFAAPRGEAGGTRHVELFSRLDGWEHLIIASDLNPQTGRRVGDSEGFVTVPVMGYSSNGVSRILNWVSYAGAATLRGLRVGRVDVVYGSSPHLLAALAGWLLSITKRAPFVLEVRDLWPKILVDMNHLSESSPIYRALTALEEFLYARARTIVIMAEGSRTELVSRGVPADKIVYIPNGADPEDFVPSAPRDELRRRYGFDRITAVYAGAHGPANGLDLLLDGAAEAPDVDVVLVGGGVLKHDLQQDAEKRHLANVRFLDPVPKSEIPDLLAAADIGLHVLADVELFHSAVSPNKVFDYMASGLPIITNCPGLVADIVETAHAGIATDPNDLKRGLQYMSQLSDDQRLQMGRSGKDWIEVNQSRSSMVTRLAAALNRFSPKAPTLYIDALNQRKGGGQQVALATIEALTATSERPPVLALKNSPLEEAALRNGFPVISRTDSLTARIFRTFAPSALINRDIQNAIVYTIFGPPLRGPHIRHTTVGVAYSNLFYPEVHFWQHETFLRRIIHQAKDRARLKSILSANAHVYETDAVRIRARNQHATLRRAQSIVMPPSPRVEFHSARAVPRVDKERPRILLAASWHPNKNLDQVPAIAARLEEMGISADFIITISEESRGGRLLSTQFDRRDISERLHLIGTVGPAELQEELHNADVILLISELESFSNNIIEAFASRTPLVISDRDWAHSIAKGAALYADPYDAHEVAAAIRKALEPSTQKKMVRLGQEILDGYRDPTERAKTILNFVRSAASQ